MRSNPVLVTKAAMGALKGIEPLHPFRALESTREGLECGGEGTVAVTVEEVNPFVMAPVAVQQSQNGWSLVGHRPGSGPAG